MTAFVDYYRCPADLATIGTRADLSATAGFFKFNDAIGFGRVVGRKTSAYASDPLSNVAGDVRITAGRTELPFDLSEVARNLREERYSQNGYNFLQKSTAGSTAQ